MPRPWLRVDDLRAGESLRCPPPSRVLTAVRPGEVADVLQTVHDATGGDSRALGYVAHEAHLLVGQESVHRRPGVAVETSSVGGS